ncbi:hypothetical protein [Microbacterium sp. 13-71-7]|uniref:hypothetical protein n=1 Tax=Microbacterium sp. 13-71-7 TaxID=1970399 RepID=UPI0025D695A1|nr:hypothetical protein [Microbacterium sp. 13-71-7]
MLSHLDARERFEYSIWRMTDPRGRMSRIADQFIRASGSARAMVVVVTLRGEDGVIRAFTVARPGVYQGARVEVRTGDRTAVRVFPNEVFEVDEAAAIFYTYYLTDQVAQPYQLREEDPADTAAVPLLWSHAESFNGGEFQYLTGDEEPVADHLRTILNQADGKRRFTYSIWRMTDPDDLRADVGDYIQAGGSAEALSIELGYPGPDGAQRLCTLGHPDQPVEPTTTVPISTDRAVRVFANEVFTADEAAVIFDEYYRTGRVSGILTRRELDLAAVLSEPR